jgi:hypothetical protein
MEFQKLTGAGSLLSGGGGAGVLKQALIRSEKTTIAGEIYFFLILSAP